MDPTVQPTQGRGRIKVVTLIDYLLATGGAERVALSIATRLDPERFESILCASRWPAPAGLEEGSRRAREELSRAGVRLLGLGRSGKVDVWVWGRLARFLARERVDVLHAHKFGSNVWGTIAGRAARVPVLLAHEHTWSYEGQPIRRLLDREVIARGADRFIAVSRADQRRMSEVEHIDPARTLFIPLGTAPSPAQELHDVRSELGLAPGSPVIGTVGLLRAQKAHDVLLQAAALLKERWPALRVLIVGDGPLRDQLQSLARELGLQETVRFLGYRHDVASVLAAMDVAVCSSDFEGSPIAMLEYMDAALPIASTDVGGIPDLIESGRHGLLVPRRDPAALAGAIGQLLEDPERARAMGELARARRRAEFDVDVMVARLQELYVELLSLSRRGRRESGA